MSLAFPAETLSKPRGQVVRYALHGAPLPRASTTLATDAFRAAALSAFHAIAGDRESFLLSGHNAKGTADQEHRHAYYLPVFSRDNLTGLLVVSPHDRFSASETDALAAVRVIRWAGPSTRTSVELLDADEHSCFQVATHWVSVTPYAPLRRFWGTSGKSHLTPERQLAVELNKCCSMDHIDVQLLSETRARLRLPTRSRPSRPQWQRAFNVEFRISDPICGPLALGHSAHFGLGLFMPVAPA